MGKWIFYRMRVPLAGYYVLVPCCSVDMGCGGGMNKFGSVFTLGLGEPFSHVNPGSCYRVPVAAADGWAACLALRYLTYIPMGLG